MIVQSTSNSIDLNQELDSKPYCMLGIKCGLNLATFLIGNTGNYSYEEGRVKVGFIGGVSLGYKFHKFFTLQPEVLFSMKGTKEWYDGTMMGNDLLRVQGLNYIEIPILFCASTPTALIAPNLYIGPSFGFRVGMSLYEEWNGEVEDTDTLLVELKKTYKPFDIGLVFGGGIKFKIGSQKLITDVRYTLGLLQMKQLTEELKDAGVTKSDQWTVKNSVLSFIVGYEFKIGK